MADIVRTNTNKNTVELKHMINASGCNMDVVYVDGIPFTAMGYVSEADKEASLRAIQMAVDGSRDLTEAAMKLMNVAELQHANIDPDEQIMVDDLEIMISYKDKKAYRGLEEVANLDDLNLPALGKDVIKALLTDRVKLWVKTQLETQNTEYDDCDDYDDYDY